MELKLSQLAKLPEDRRNDALAGLVRAAKAPRNGQTRALDRRIRAFEFRYEMSSAEMLERLADGRLNDTADIAKWTTLLYARDRG